MSNLSEVEEGRTRYLMSWVAVTSYFKDNVVNIHTDQGAGIIDAHSLDEAKGALTRVVQKEFPDRRVGVLGNELTEGILATPETLRMVARE